ncbi:hypothetical protein ACFQS7_05035 [Dankookia sp. GCM10030260]|uniref:hypothetical protein n=1 Tax=Dankookia sp. GCM10030260 TaxID=3273390 RepID=UPI003606ECD2
MARQEEDTGPVRGPLMQRGTLSRGAIAGGIVLLLLGGLAWMRADDRPDSPLDHYRRMGLTAGPLALQRDLLAEFPPGTDPSPVVRRLEGLGFTCRPAEARWSCLRVERGEGRSVWQAEVALGLKDGALDGLEARFAEEIR